MPWVYLAAAILSEIVGTLSLKASDGFSRLGPSALVVAGYGAAFFCLAQALRDLPVGTAYAIWAAVGVAAVALLGVVFFGERLSVTTGVGLVCIIVGVVLVTTGTSTAE